MKKLLAVAIFSSVTGAAQASQIDLAGNLGTRNQIDNYTFSVTSTGSVNLFTTSDFATDPLLTLWVKSGSDWTKVASNDNRVGANFNETVNSLDAKIFQSLAAGNYDISVTWSGNSAVGNLLSNGFSGNGNGGANLNDSFNPYQLTIVGNVSPNLAAVPLPGAVWLFGSVALGFLGLSKKRD